MTVPEFLMRLHMLGKRRLAARDIIVLYYIMTHPGCNGADASNACGLKHRSAIALNLTRLLEANFIEDRRIEFTKRNPCVLFVLPAGVEFWHSIKP